MKTIYMLIILLSVCQVCLAIQNPVEYVGDTIRSNTNTAVDDALSKIRIETHAIKKGILELIKKLLTAMLEAFTVAAVCWMFSFLVSKNTAKMVKFVGIALGINQFLKLFI